MKWSIIEVSTKRKADTMTENTQDLINRCNDCHDMIELGTFFGLNCDLLVETYSRLVTETREAACADLAQAAS